MSALATGSLSQPAAREQLHVSKVVMSDSDEDDDVGKTQPSEETPVQSSTRSTKTTSSVPHLDGSDDDVDPQVARRQQQLKAVADKKLREAEAAQAADAAALEEQQRWLEFEKFVASTSAAVLPDDGDSAGTPDIDEGQWASLDKDDAGREEVADEHTWSAPWSQTGSMSMALPGVDGYFAVPAQWPGAGMAGQSPQAAAWAPPQPAWGMPQAAAMYPSTQAAAPAYAHPASSGAAAASADPDVARRMKEAVHAAAFTPATTAAPRPKRTFNPNAAAFNGQW